MKVKVIFGAILLAFGASAYAYHYHSWQKVSEFEGMNGKTICRQRLCRRNKRALQERKVFRIGV
jgi:hypothetical protein